MTKLANICLFYEINYSNAKKQEQHWSTNENNTPSLFLCAKKLEETITILLLASRSTKLLPLMPKTSTVILNIFSIISPKWPMSTTGHERVLPTHFGLSPGSETPKQPACPMIEQANKYPNQATILRHWQQSMSQLFLALLASVCVFSIDVALCVPAELCAAIHSQINGFTYLCLFVEHRFCNAEIHGQLSSLSWFNASETIIAATTPTSTHVPSAKSLTATKMNKLKFPTTNESHELPKSLVLFSSSLSSPWPLITSSSLSSFSSSSLSLLTLSQTMKETTTKVNLSGLKSSFLPSTESALSVPASLHSESKVVENPLPMQNLEYAALIQEKPIKLDVVSSIVTVTVPTTLFVDPPQLPATIERTFQNDDLELDSESLKPEHDISGLPEDDKSWLLPLPSEASEVALSQLPPMNEEQQAAADLLTKGFSIPTFLPPFPVFAVADLPAYINSVSSTTTTAATTVTETSSRLFIPSKDAHNNLDGGKIELDGVLSLWRPPALKLQVGANDTVVTVQMGNHAYLPCKVEHIPDKPVSWVRQRDGHIISVDQTTFIADQRFQALYKHEDDTTWSLQIKYVQSIDEGWYECQVSAEPKTSAKIYLHIIVPLTELIGDQSRFVKAGSKVALHCIVRGTLDPPQYIIWYRDKTQVGDDNKMGWYTQLDRNIFGNNESNQNTIGSLIIPSVRKSDSGNYTCQPSNSASVSVDLHVLSGEYSASAIMSTARRYNVLPLSQQILLFFMPIVVMTITKT